MKTQNDTNPEENKVDGQLPFVPDPLLEKLKTTFLSEYFPILKWQQGVILLTTTEIYSRFQAVYPGNYGMDDVANWLFNAGYELFQAGEMQYQWLLMPATLEL